MTSIIAESKPLLEVVNVSHRYGTVPALSSVSFTLDPGEVVGLIGPNGAGKTTLLECMAGLIPCQSGTIALAAPAGGSASVSSARRAIYYIPDSASPWETRPVGWTLDFFAALHDAPASEVGALLDRLALRELASQPGATLSRGQRKRALLALGLLTRTPALLLDEPFDGLDLRQARDAMALLRECAASGRTLLLSIHQLNDAARVSDRLVLLSHGHVVGEGTLDELRYRANLPDADLEEIFLALT